MSNVTDPNDTGATETKDVLSKESVSEMINTAIGMREKRFEKRLSEMLKSEFAAAQPKAQEPADTEAEPTGKKAELAALRRELETQKQLFATSEKQRKESARREATSRAHQELTSALTGSGKVKPEAVGMVIDLIKGRGHLDISDDGQASYRIGEDVFSIAEGAERFLASKEAVYFAPPPNQANGRNVAVKTPYNASGSTDTKNQALDALISDLPSVFGK